jgi:transposase, IS5 family
MSVHNLPNQGHLLIDASNALVNIRPLAGLSLPDEGREVIEIQIEAVHPWFRET